jgi:hypothetical protein
MRENRVRKAVVAVLDPLDRRTRGCHKRSKALMLLSSPYGIEARPVVPFAAACPAHGVCSGPHQYAPQRRRHGL